eukprot:UN13120
MSEGLIIETYHVSNNLGDESLLVQFFNPVFFLITLLLLIFSSIMLAICSLLLYSFMRPHCAKMSKLKRKCRCCQQCSFYRCRLLLYQRRTRQSTGRSHPSDIA